MPLESERVVLASPTSYAGSGKRIWKLTGVGNVVARWLVMIPLAIILVAAAWTLVTIYYVLLGLPLLPWRLWRRHVRKRKREELRHRERVEGA